MELLHTIRLGMTQTYLLRGAGGYLLVDAGPRGFAPTFRRALSHHGIAPQQIRLIIVTHAHFDHVGSLHALQNLCNCPVLAHRAEAELLAHGRVVLPPGTNWLTRFLIRLARRHPRRVKKLGRFDPVRPDRTISRPLDLAAYGFDAQVRPTPGHTPGSLSVVTASGRAMVGDLAVNYLPAGRGPFWPPFGDDLALIRESWSALRSMGVTTFYPAHGRPFKVEKLPF